MESGPGPPGAGKFLSGVHFMMWPGGVLRACGDFGRNAWGAPFPNP